MNFQIDARTIFKLGKELISSDDMALYELIKNSLDAGAKEVEVTVEHFISRESFIKTVRSVEKGEMGLSEATEHLKDCSVYEEHEDFAEFIRLLSEEVEDRSKYLEILIREFRKLNKIRIKDLGSGMSMDDLQDIYLMIGTRNRLLKTIAGQDFHGDKGIGRLSTMRLGNQLKVVTSTKGEKNWNVLEIDWDEFNGSSHKLISEIEIVPTVGCKKKDSNLHGTTITISDLNADWTYEKFMWEIQNKLKRFLNPFIAGFACNILKLAHNAHLLDVPSIPTKLLKVAHAKCEAKFNVDEKGNATIEGEVNYLLKNKSQKFKLNNIEVISIARSFFKRFGKKGDAEFQEMPFAIETLRDLKNFSVEIYWFNRKMIKSIESFTSTQKESREEIAKWSGGLMVYRNNVRVLPYGEPDDDWLLLDQSTFGSSGFRLNRQQVIGLVSISTPSEVLNELTNREGLLDSPTSRTLKNIVSWIVHVQFGNFLSNTNLDERKESANKIIEGNSMQKYISNLKKAIKKLEEKKDDVNASDIEDITNTANNLIKECNVFEKNIEDVKTQAKKDHNKIVYLAGIGLLNEFIFHELYRIVHYIISDITRPTGKVNSIPFFTQQLKTLEKRIAQFDRIATRQSQIKTDFNLCDLLCDTMEVHEHEFDAYNIKYRLKVSQNPFEIKAVKGMVLQILENLVVNSTYWLKQQFYLDKNFSPKLTIELFAEEKKLVVSDNGPGVYAPQKENIFQPFITTKPSGMGKGLGLYIARDLAEYHGWTLAMRDDSTIENKERLNDFVLQMK